MNPQRSENLQQSPSPMAAPVKPPPLPSAITTKAAQPIDSLATSALPRSGPLPYFHVKRYSSWWPGRTVYRVYVTDQDFLFIDLGISTLTPEDHIRQGPAMAGGGAIPGLIGAAVGYCMATAARQRLDRLNKSLAAADKEILREYVEGDKTSFLLPYDEVQAVSLDPKTAWSSLACPQLVAFLVLNRRQGPMTLALIAPHEMVTVMGELKRVFGEVACNLSWRAF